MHPIDFFYRYAGHVLRPYMTVDASSEGDLCGVCGRPRDQWLNPDEKVSFVQYGIAEVHCLPCHSLFEDSVELFGVERMAKGTPVPMKLGMATGCGAMVTPEKTTLYLNGFIDKMDKADKPPFEMVRLSGKAAHHWVLENPPACDQYLYIGNFGRKKADLVSHLKLSRPGLLCISEESGCIEVPVEAFRALRQGSEGVPDALVASTRRLLADLYTGRLSRNNEADEQKVTAHFDRLRESAPQILPALKCLPVDPHQALNVLRLW